MTRSYSKIWENNITLPPTSISNTPHMHSNKMVLAVQYMASKNVQIYSCVNSFFSDKTVSNIIIIVLCTIDIHNSCVHVIENHFTQHFNVRFNESELMHVLFTCQVPLNP